MVCAAGWKSNLRGGDELEERTHIMLPLSLIGPLSAVPSDKRGDLLLVAMQYIKDGVTPVFFRPFVCCPLGNDSPRTGRRRGAMEQQNSATAIRRVVPRSQKKRYAYSRVRDMEGNNRQRELSHVIGR